MRLAVAAAAVLLASTSAAPALDFAALHTALKDGDTPAMGRLVEQVYAEAGISWNDRLRWKYEGFDHTFNFYDPWLVEITLGSIPLPDQVAGYWSNWSQVLTGGAWVASDFFTDDAQAGALAAFNQLVLALHEAGHAVTFRYDFDHLERHDYDINCREYYADRLADAALQDLADADATTATLLADYIRLMASMNAAIAPADRYHIESLAALDADCKIISVAQPTPETLQPYASAFFERQRLLTGADLPTLAETARQHLLPHQATFMASFPYVPAKTYALSTLETLSDLRPVGRYTQGPGTYAPSFDPSGTLRVADLVYDAEASTLTLRYGTPGALELVVDAEDYAIEGGKDLELVNIAALSPDIFFVLMRESLPQLEERYVIAAAGRLDGEWTTEVLDRLDVEQARVMLAPSGEIYLFLSSDRAKLGFEAAWVAIKVDPRSGEMTGTETFKGFHGVPLAIAASGDLVTFAANLLFEFDREQRFYTLAGNHLPGLKDGTDPARTELGDISTAQVTSEGLLLLDESLDGDGVVIRRLQVTLQDAADPSEPQ